ncbi:hypothetical protein H8L47_01555 [Undibacterium sp. NL8W]|uniref:Uncharacterized protein n=1 Tax=Undibacterium umbellatum TaxID=2762300 RepID=A0ABR6Z3F3_9BURK|nr:hypothetical protein [Undibacterium umbellatum]
MSFGKASEKATRQTQNNLLDHAIKSAGLKNDAGLARMLEVAPPVISKIRHKHLPVGATLAVAITEETDLSIADIAAILAGRVTA